jgi:hypothetical protein
MLEKYCRYENNMLNYRNEPEYRKTDKFMFNILKYPEDFF